MSNNQNAGFPEWLEVVRKIEESGQLLGDIKVQGLELGLWASDPGYYPWLLQYLHPLPLEKPLSVQYRYRMGCFVADEIFQQAIRSIDQGTVDISRVDTGRREIERIVFSPELIVDCDRYQGILWVTDLARYSVTMVFSSKTHWKSLEVGRCAREIINGYLEDRDWQAFHSGAVQTDSSTFVVIGNAGAGKTSLILSLVSSGARFISNERSYITLENDELHTLVSPLPVAIGMGTALQFPQIRHFIRHPEYCLYPPRRMNLDLIRRTPENRWSELEDKVQLLPAEIIAALSAPEGLAGGKVMGIVVPDMSTTKPVGARVLSRDELKAVISNNYFTRDHRDVYPAWMPLPFNLPDAARREEIIEALCELPAIAFTFFSSRDRRNEMQRYPAMIEAGFQACNNE